MVTFDCKSARATARLESMSARKRVTFDCKSARAYVFDASTLDAMF